MLAASLDTNPKALERARKRHRFRNPWYDRRFSGAIRCSLLVVVLVTMTMYLRTNSAAKAAERLNARLHPLLLSRDDDAQYAEEFNFTASLPARKSKKKPGRARDRLHRRRRRAAPPRTAVPTWNRNARG